MASSDDSDSLANKIVQPEETRGLQPIPPRSDADTGTEGLQPIEPSPDSTDDE